MNFRAKTPPPSNLLINHQYHPTTANAGFVSARSPIKPAESLNNPTRYSDPNYKPTGAADNKSKVSFSLTTFPTLPIARQPPLYHNQGRPIMGSNGDDQKQKFREVTESLASLKKRLEGIVIDKKQNGANWHEYSSTHKTMNKNQHTDRSFELGSKPSQQFPKPAPAFFQPSSSPLPHITTPYVDIKNSAQFKANRHESGFSHHNRNDSSDFNLKKMENYDAVAFTSPPKFYSQTQDTSGSTYQTKSADSTSSFQTHGSYEKQRRDLLQKIQDVQSEKQKIQQEKQRIKSLLSLQQTNNRNLQHRLGKVSEQLEECKSRESMLRERVAFLERQAAHAKSRNRNSFDDALKDQLEQTKKIKQTIQEKNEEILRLNDALLLNRRSTEEAVNDANIQRLKYMAQKKQMEQLHQIAILQKDNEIKTLEHALETMQSKLQVAIKQNKSKDAFIQQYMVGRVKTEQEKQHVKKVLSNYVIEFPTNNLKEKLLQEKRQLDALRQELERQRK